MRRDFSIVAAILAFLPGAFGVIVPGSKDLGNIWFIGDLITQSNSDNNPDSSRTGIMQNIPT